MWISKWNWLTKWFHSNLLIKNQQDLHLPIKSICIQSTNLFHSDIKNRVSFATANIVSKATIFATKQIAMASCVVLINECVYQLLAMTFSNCISLKMCHHQSIVKRKNRLECEIICINFMMLLDLFLAGLQMTW